MKTLLFNPFEKFSGMPLVLSGVLFTVVGTLFAYFFNMRFDGVLDSHIATNTSYSTLLIDNIINILCLVLFLFASAKYFNTKTRLIDIITLASESRVFKKPSESSIFVFTTKHYKYGTLQAKQK